jgi:hypothetical protein
MSPVLAVVEIAEPDEWPVDTYPPIWQFRQNVGLLTGLPPTAALYNVPGMVSVPPWEAMVLLVTLLAMVNVSLWQSKQFMTTPLDFVPAVRVKPL